MLAKGSFLSLKGIFILCLVIGVIANVLKITKISPGSAILIVTAAVALMYGASRLAPLVDQLSRRQYLALIVVGLLIIFIGELLVLSEMRINSKFDTYRVISQADRLAAGNHSWPVLYFYRYPNNVILASFLGGWFSLFNFMGISEFLALEILNIVLLNTFILLIIRTTAQLSGRQSYTLAALAFFVFSPFAYTYYLQIFYSDLPVMISILVVIRAVYFWPKWSRRDRISNGIVTGLATLVAQLLRPNTLVIVPALLIVALVCWRGIKVNSHLFVLFGVLVVAIGLSVPVKSLIYRGVGFSANEKYELPLESWIAMGVQPETKGTYNYSVVVGDLRAKNKSERKSNDLKIIKNTLKRLGPIGIGKQLIFKTETLLNSGDINAWYSGGQREAPEWYLNQRMFIGNYVRIIYQLMTLMIYFTLIWFVLTWRYPSENKMDKSWIAMMFVLVLSLGYMGFHILVWEVEQRYGEILRPLFWLLLLSLGSTRSIQLVSEPKIANNGLWLPKLVSGLGVVSVIGAVWLQSGQSRNTVVASQSIVETDEPLNVPTKLKPGQTIRQQITMNHVVNRSIVRTFQQTKASVTLVNLTTGVRYSLRQGKKQFYRTVPIPAGKYHLEVHNGTKQVQLFNTTATHAYQLANSPLYVNGKPQRYRSLIYVMSIAD
ncbi:hypothetical protein [Lacticaseibacillus nasuensis]|uniref:hypothetical protein n=1 Tax=Lacticaseibacillus nasuensis TaxID=944671 RepID=UPI002245D60D|nr:hypothetical protein [Lacticaseibacillus nasuensis]MCX2456191.1 hypothetical protein [Lacticaseibacillus nasuensis]